MNTLELTLQRKTDSGYPVIAALTRPGGFLPLRREGMLNLDIAALSELQYDPLAYGTALGQALFVDEIRDTFREGLAGGEALRVLLSIEAPDLRALNWHRLAAPFDGRWRFLASQQNTPFSLSIPSPASAHFPAIGRRDLRALVLVAGPESLSGDYKLAAFDVPATLAGIQESLGDIPCDVLQNPSLDALCAALTATPYTILHLVCHGAVNQSGETILFFPKDSKGSPTPATDLLNRLSSLARLPHFAFISACESALPHNGLGSLAGRLVRELGLPAVLAMTDRVSIATASAIAAPFYVHLYQHGQPDLALAQSLAGLQGAHDLTVPAIFSRLGDRPLFDDNAERALTDKELEFGLAKLAESLPERAPVMDNLRDSLTRRLRSTMGADSKSLSESSRTERKETLDQLNSLSLEALDLSFNALCLDKKIPDYDSRSPFRGLESFRPDDAEYFFGRETLTRKLVQKMNEHNFLAVLGASGSGKSSLVMAGLIPALDVPYAIFRPGVEPLAELEKALALLPSPRGRGAGGEGLLVVDQFEELFTLSAREQRSEFISRLLEQVQKIRVVITLRADFLGEVAPFKSLKDEVQNHQEIIPPMDEAELRRAMEGQAACAGLRFESDLSQQMLDDVSGEPGAMPLLQHALWTLWTRRHGRWLRADEYRAFGGVKQAIASTAEAVFARCTDFEKERLRDIFLRLTRLDESADGRDTRRRVLLRDLIPADSDPESTKLLIKQLADARLVVVTGDEVEVAHEALIRHWERLRAWLNDDRDNLRLREGVSDDARHWDNAERDESLLNHRGARLELALVMSKNPRYRLNPVEQAYLDGCVALREREKAAATRRRKYAITGVSAALLVIMVILVGWGWTSNENSKQLGYQVATSDAAKATAIWEADVRAIAQAEAVSQKSEAEKQARIALARQLSAQAFSINTAYNSRQMIATLLNIESMNLYPNKESASFLINNNNAAIPLSRMSHDDFVSSIAISPDGENIVAGDYDGVVRVWKIATGKQLTQIHHGSKVYSVAISLDGNLIASAGCDTDNYNVCKQGTAQVWDLITGKEVAHTAYSVSATMVAFSPDGRHVLVDGCDKWQNICVQGTIHILDLVTGKEVVRITHDYSVNSIAFSSNGKYVVSGGEDNTVRLWETSTGIELTHMTIDDDVEAVAFSPDDRYVASGGDPTARVWDILTGTEVARMTHTGGNVSSVKFSPDSVYVISGSHDGTARVWEVATGREVSRMTHDGGVSSVSFSPDGNYAISGSADNTARVWEVATGREVSRMTHDGGVSSVTFSSDGMYLISSARNIIQAWRPATVKESIRIAHDGWVSSATLNVDGDLLISAAGNTVSVWMMATGDKKASMSYDGQVNAVSASKDGRYVISSGMHGIYIWDTFLDNVTSLSDYIDGASCVEFSPNDKFVASCSNDDIVRIWEIATGKEVARMTHEAVVSSVAFSPDGKLVISGSWDGITRIWEVATGKEVFRIKQTDLISSVSISPDENFVVSGSNDGTARVWETVSGKEVARMVHDDVVEAVAFSPDGNFVVSGSRDGTARVWEVATGNEVARLNHGDWVTIVLFSPDGNLVVSSSNKIVRVWSWRVKDLIANACTVMPRNLTRAEWQQYVGDVLPYQAVCPNLPIEP